jgi:hypothetical protein
MAGGVKLVAAVEDHGVRQPPACCALDGVGGWPSPFARRSPPETGLVTGLESGPAGATGS